MLFCFGGESFGNASEVYKRVGYDVPLYFFFGGGNRINVRETIFCFSLRVILFRNTSGMYKHENDVIFFLGESFFWECLNVKGMLYVVFGSRIGILLCDL